MPCGHIFCKGCIHAWLEKQCTCPVCRFEIETNDREFEERRKKKPIRKPRYKKEDLLRMTAKELKGILTTYRIEGTGFAEKREIVDAIVNSDKVEIEEGVT